MLDFGLGLRVPDSQRLLHCVLPDHELWFSQACEGDLHSTSLHSPTLQRTFYLLSEGCVCTCTCVHRMGWDGLLSVSPTLALIRD